MIKAGFVSLGCAKNRVDTEVMLGLLSQRGIEITDDPAEADVLIVNTCSFIDSAKDESITTILQMADYKKTGKCRSLLVAGCLSERYRQGLLDEMPEVDAIIGTGAWHRITEALDAVLAGQRVMLIGDTDTLYDETMPRIHTTPEYSAYVKVADGCDNRCSYCVIPLVRGRFRSRRIESVVAEVTALAKAGVKEINLIAQDTTSFGKDLHDSAGIIELLEALVKIPDVPWIRLLYCYPRFFSDELIALIAREERILSYIDLPLQHIHDDILTAMNRRDSSDDIRKLLAQIREVIPGVALRTTFIVGFPGEEEEHFATLRQFMLEQKFDHVGIFTYSPEEDTLAAVMDHQVPEEIKEERYHELMAIQAEITEKVNRSKEGQIVDVLIEGVAQAEGNVVFGRSYREAPDVDGRIYIENPPAAIKAGDVIKARIVQGFAYDLVAEPCAEVGGA